VKLPGRSEAPGAPAQGVAAAPEPRASAPRRSPRRRAREYALQGVYQWLLAGGNAATISAHLGSDERFDRADTEFFRLLLEGVISNAGELEGLLSGATDRPVPELSPVERSILLLAVFELRHCPETPARVVVNEAIELAKSFGGTDGYKYVNGVLDKLVRPLRPLDPA
jgi:N utilization substance protein B